MKIRTFQHYVISTQKFWKPLLLGWLRIKKRIFINIYDVSSLSLKLFSLFQNHFQNFFENDPPNYLGELKNIIPFYIFQRNVCWWWHCFCFLSFILEFTVSISTFPSFCVFFILTSSFVSVFGLTSTFPATGTVIKYWVSLSAIMAPQYSAQNA